jgi:hypothetical protein
LSCTTLKELVFHFEKWEKEKQCGQCIAKKRVNNLKKVKESSSDN